MNYGFVIDNRKCIGCHACTVACKAEHDTPLGVNRTWVKYIEKGEFPSTHRAFSVMRCNHCADAPCVEICPTAALYTRRDGIVDFDHRRCIGCKACMQACPYDAIHIDPVNHTAAKCNYCAHRVEIGLEPPCVNVCPTHAIISGNLDDPVSEIAQLLAHHPVQVRKPEKGTRPKLYYIEGDAASLRPGATASDGSTLWSDPPPQGVDLVAWAKALERHGAEQVPHERQATSARTVYATSQPHRGSWGASVALYLFTKSVAAGVMLVAVPLLLLGSPGVAAALPEAFWLALVFLGLTNLLLVWKLERRDRFVYVLLKPQWRSWLTRGAYVMVGYGALLLLALVAGLPRPLAILLWLFAFGTAVYSAFLFNQARGRDLWQSATLPLQLVVQAVVAGGASLALLSVSASRAVLAAGLASSLFVLACEFLTRHPTEDGRAAAEMIVSGRYRRPFWLAVVAGGHLVPLALLAGGLPAPAALLALVGVAVFEDLFVRAGQALPLA